MIGYLRGHILEQSEGKLLLTLGPTGEAVAMSPAIGYAVTVPTSPAYLGFLPGKLVELFIYTHVREDALELYGFSTRAEKELFLTLLTVNGIGPKGGLGILSKTGVDLLIQAILAGDKDSLLQIPGIGKKTAERVVLELQDTVRKKFEAGVFTDGKPQFADGNRQEKGIPEVGAPGLQSHLQMLRDAKDALVSLGYKEQEVASTLKRALEEKNPPKKVEDLIRTALRQLG